MNGMFRNVTNDLSSYDLSNWYTGGVTDMNSMFRDATTFNGDISNWSTSNVTDMGSMFYGATAFNGDLSDWDVSHTTSLYSMFRGATAFDISSLGSWTFNNPDMRRFFTIDYNTATFTALLYAWYISNGGSAPYISTGIGVNQGQQAWKIYNDVDLYTAYNTSGTIFVNLNSGVINTFWIDGPV
jgi:hypothetical protein